MPKKEEVKMILSSVENNKIKTIDGSKFFFSLSVTLKYPNNYEALCFLEAFSFMVE